MVTLPPLHKRAGNWQLDTYETAVVAWRGRPVTITFNRGKTGNVFDTHASSFTVRDFRTGEVLATHAWCGGLGSAIVGKQDGLIHIFGSTDWGSNNNAVLHSVLDECSFAPSTPNIVMQTNSAYRVFNTDVCWDGAQYVMTYETQSGIYFATSPMLDLPFSPVMNASIHQGQYCACPSIDSVDDWYFLTYLSHTGDGRYVTQVSRSQDLLTWQDFTGSAAYPAYICLLAPDGPGEGINASDVSFAECDGTVYGVYLDGDQQTWAHLRTFVYFGTIRQLMGEFF